MLLIKNIRIIFLDNINEGSILIENNRIKAINPSYDIDCDVIDGKGLYLSPGFIDVHIHGAGGYDTMDGTYTALNEISKTIVKHGTTSFLPTTMTVSADDINKSVESIAYAIKEGTDGANILGVHLEGPFISPDMIGAQNPSFILKPTIENFDKIVGDNIRIVKAITIAPEVDGAKELIKFLHQHDIVVSIGHSKATYVEAVDAINTGASHSTHLFNAMTPLHHREPGVVGAIFDTDITTETISDGIHIAYPSLRSAYRIKGLDKVLLVSDAMMACCMPDGDYSLGGQKVIVKEGAARLTSGALAGSVLTLDKAVQNVKCNTNYALNEVIKMATYNAAKHCKVENKKGLIKEGYDADLILFDDNINIKLALVNGKIVYNDI
ncbi:N-acetylglucosamine-6-phosphate deacetylase [Clostridium sp. C8-1-8]|uniref:N-acetylglucosamine-6-phosphate deacetylase n=1 Tax=Clostridium sp. C8-1-8 TaxID=2698831 RepID=UPI00137109A6|nr:N-acetylglucosamine-6-phosphate deacetylase [Clostridium sp. C8-1-8]